jgi:DNA invertase Pin-like site-specific DNA recombinase
MDLSEKWCKDRGLVLDESLRMSDEGLSAYDGKNIAVGALRDFFSKIRNKDIRPGSYLLVESLDRLSRENAYVAVGLFSELVNAGIRIVTLQDNVEYNSETIQDVRQLFYSLFVMSNANEESKKKSIRIREAWKHKKDNADKIPVTSQCPSWIRMKNGKFIIIEKRAKWARLIIKMSLCGLSIVNIQRDLNRRRIKTISGRCLKWARSIIYYIITNRTAIGEYRPNYSIGGKRISENRTFHNYYPAIVSKNDYEKSLSMFKGRKRTSSHGICTCTNLFEQLVKYGPVGKYEGNNFRLVSTRIKTAHLLRLYNYRIIGLFSIPYEAFEKIILDFLRGLNYNEIMMPPDIDKANDDISILNDKITEIKLDINKLEKRKVCGINSSKLSKLKESKYNLEEKLQDLLDMKRHKYSSDHKMADLFVMPTTIEGRRKLSKAIRRIVDGFYIYRLKDGIVVVTSFKCESRAKVAIRIDMENSTYTMLSKDDTRNLIEKYNNGKTWKKPEIIRSVRLPSGVYAPVMA